MKNTFITLRAGTIFNKGELQESKMYRYFNRMTSRGFNYTTTPMPQGKQRHFKSIEVAEKFLESHDMLKRKGYKVFEGEITEVERTKDGLELQVELDNLLSDSVKKAFYIDYDFRYNNDIDSPFYQCITLRTRDTKGYDNLNICLILKVGEFKKELKNCLSDLTLYRNKLELHELDEFKSIHMKKGE